MGRLIIIRSCLCVFSFFIFILSPSSLTYAQTDGDPLVGVRDVLHADELVMIWSQDNGSGSRFANQRIYDLDPTQGNVNLRLVPKTRETDGRISGNMKLDIASGNFLGGSYEHLVAAWAGLNDSIMVIVPEIVNSTLDWSTVNRTTLRGPLQSTAKSTNSKVHTVTGNFYGDRKDECLVAYHGADSAIHLAVFSFNPGSLVPQQRGTMKGDTLAYKYHDSWDITTGDYDGDGFAEIAVAYAEKVGNGVGGRMTVAIYDVDASGSLSLTASKVIVNNIIGSLVIEVAASSGNYDIVDANDEIAFCYEFDVNKTGNEINLYLIDYIDSTNTIVSDPGKSLTEIAEDSGTDPLSIGTGDINGDYRDDIVIGINNDLYLYSVDDSLRPTFRRVINTGLFEGTENNQYSDAFIAVGDMDRDQRAEIAIVKNTYNANNPVNQVFNLRVYHLLDTTFYNVQLYASRTDEEVTPDGFGLVRHYAIAMGDFDGDRIRLGEAVLYHKSAVLQPTVVVNAPPVHFDVFPGDAVLYDISGCYPSSDCGFSSTYVNTASNEVAVSTEVHSDWGVDATLSAGGSVLGFGVKAKIKTMYGEGFSKSAGSSQSLTVTIGRTADRSDWVFANVVNYDIYEYPVYEGVDPTPKGWVIALLPISIEPRWIEDKDDSYIGNIYRPNHEVGHILSYPTVDPPDVGTTIYQFPQQDIGSSGSGFTELGSETFQDASASTTQTIGLEVGASVGVWGIQLAASGKYSKTEISTQTTTIGGQLTIRSEFGSLSNPFSSIGRYAITPFSYWATNGALVMDYKVLDHAGSFWNDKYGGKTDLTFNLPWRLDPEKGHPLPGDGEAYRSRTRDVDLSSDDPLAGDTVTITARVRNLALLDAGNPVVVRFFMGDPDDGGTLIGEDVLSGGLPARASGIASISWIVPPAIPRTTRIYASVDPDNAYTNEVHEDNNKGWTPVSDYSIITDVDDQDQDPTPSSFHLYQAYPNPFNPVTTIRYDLPSIGRVSLRVYTVIGELVATLVDDVQSAGAKVVPFDGSPLPSGVYFYRLTMGSHTGIQKMILMK